MQFCMVRCKEVYGGNIGELVQPSVGQLDEKQLDRSSDNKKGKITARKVLPIRLMSRRMYAVLSLSR